MFETQREFATKTAYVALGAPVVVSRMLRDYGVKLADNAQAQMSTFADEGEKTAKKIQGGNVVEEIQHRVDLEKVQDRVEKLRDQLEGALQSWRESFTPTDTRTPAKKVTVESDGPEATDTAATDTAATAKAAPTKTAAKPAARKPATKASTTKTGTTQTSAKTPAQKKAPAESAAK